MTDQLRKLEKVALINRKVFAEVPLKVECTITAKGKTLQPLIFKMRDWGLENVLQNNYLLLKQNLKLF